MNSLTAGEGCRNPWPAADGQLVPVVPPHPGEEGEAAGPAAGQTPPAGRETPPCPRYC